MPLSNKVEISSSEIHGNCWRAKENIFAGELLWEADKADHDKTFTFSKDEVKTWPKDKQDRFYSLAYLLFILLLFLCKK
jgi:hypothetical protein